MLNRDTRRNPLASIKVVYECTKRHPPLPYKIQPMIKKAVLSSRLQVLDKSSMCEGILSVLQDFLKLKFKTNSTVNGPSLNRWYLQKFSNTQ
jgi:hypothetical protein